MRKIKNNLLHSAKIFNILIIIFLIILISIISYLQYRKNEVEKKLTSSTLLNVNLNQDITALKGDLNKLQNTDQIKRSNLLEDEIKSIKNTYSKTVTVYETIIDLPPSTKDLGSYQKKFALIIKYLSDKKYASGEGELKILSDSVDKEKLRVITSLGGIDTSKLTKSSTPPSTGYSRQVVEVSGTSYIVDVVAGNLASTKVIVDTASDKDCRDNCPTLPLALYVSRNGAFAGINGSYFCPAEYPTCAGKTNSFDTLAMNVKKQYFNSDNNVYSTVPLVVFGSGFIRFVGQSSGWGRDTGVDGVLANQPLLLSGGNVTFGGDGDPKKGSKGNRSFVASKGNTAYIGVIRNVTVAEAALVLKALGMENALNLDSGGSTALWAGGYKAGPGRAIPNAILFINK